MIPPVTPGAAGGWQRDRRPHQDERSAPRPERAPGPEALELWPLLLASEAAAAPDARPLRLRVAMYMESSLPEWACDQPGSRVDFQA